MNNTLLIDHWVINDIRKEIKTFLDSNENKNTTYQNPWDTAQAMLRRHCITLSAYTGKLEQSQINNLMMHLKFSEKQEQGKPQISRQKEIIRIRAEVNEMETKRMMLRINETIGSLKR
jgi:hypothetical protein